MPAEVWWVPKVQSPCLKASAPQHTRSLQPYSEPLCELGCLLKPLDEMLLLVALTSAQLDNITVRMRFLTSVLRCTLPCTRDRRPREVWRTQWDVGWHRSEQVFQWGLLSRWHQKIRCWISLTSLCVVDSLKFRTALMPESFSTDKRVHFCCWLSAKYSVNFLMHLNTSPCSCTWLEPCDFCFCLILLWCSFLRKLAGGLFLASWKSFYSLQRILSSVIFDMVWKSDLLVQSIERY